MAERGRSLKNDQWGAALNPHHSHFLAVDSAWERTASSRGGPWGSELGLRAAVERELAARVHVPSLGLDPATRGPTIKSLS